LSRTVIFDTTSTSYHGHPHPLNCPPDAVRRSLALYYYTVERLRPDEHSTLWQEPPGTCDAASSRAAEP
jgi:hypothetical protein